MRRGAGSPAGGGRHPSQRSPVRRQGGRDEEGTLDQLPVEQGDILVTGKNCYALIKFTDNSQVTLRPNTQFAVEKYSFDRQKPKADSAVFRLIKGDFAP